MLINALCEYADLKTDPSAHEGWEEQDTHYEIILSPQGELLEIIDVREKIVTVDKKGKEKSSYYPKKTLLPKRTQKPGIDSNFIEHRPLYIFGLNFEKDSEGKEYFTPDDKTDKAKKSHKAFVEHELEFMDGLESEICTAYRNFVEKWIPENETENPVLKKICKDYQKSYYTFSIGVGKEKLEEDKQLNEKFNSIFSEKSADAENAETSVCGILGRKLPQARLHDKIKFPGGQAAGCQLICMNGDAFESYGKTQSYNSNVSEEAMKKYTLMFNYLLADKGHHIKLGDMMVVFFAMKENDADECYSFSFGLNGSGDEKAVDNSTEKEIKTVMDYAKRGYTTDSDYHVDENVDFYIAGFTPNASRICQKFICRSRFGEIIKNIQKHQDDLRIRDDSKYSVYFRNIEKELVSPKSNNEKVPAPLMTNIILSALNGTTYPDGLLSTIIRRVKTDSDEEHNHYIKLNDTRAGIIKACLNRKYKREEILMAWNDENKNPAYLCGGLFAVYEKIQQDSSGGNLNRTIKDAYFSSACSRPASVFPKLAKLSNNHLRKLSDGSAVYFNKMIQKIVGELDGEFPSTLDLDNQGRFIIGYYQMNQKLYTSKTEGKD